MRIFRTITLKLIIMLALLAPALHSYAADGRPVGIVTHSNGVTVIGNKLTNISTPDSDEISRGNITGKEDFNKFGANNDVGTAVEDVMLEGGTKTYLAASELLKLISDSTDDDGDPVGTGARTVTVYGLSDAGAMVEETATMDGTTVVTLTVPMRDVYRMKVIASGTDLSNKGTITLKNNAATATLATIGPKLGQTLMTHFTVPAGHRELIKNIVISATGGKDTTIYLFCRPPGESWQVRLSVTLNNGVFARAFDPALAISAGSDLVIRAISVQGGSVVDAGWDSILETVE